MKFDITSKLRRASYVAAMAIGLSASLVSTSAIGGRSTYYSIEYYSDATYTDLVGVKHCGCVACTTYGVVTEYAVKTDEGSCS